MSTLLHTTTLIPSSVLPIFLWDKTKYLILASKFDPLKIVIGEAGTTRNNNDTVSSVISSITEQGSHSISPKDKKNISPEEEAQGGFILQERRKRQ